MNIIDLTRHRDAKAALKETALAKERETGRDVVKRLAPELLELVGQGDLAAKLRRCSAKKKIAFCDAANIVETAARRIRDLSEEERRSRYSGCDASGLSFALFQLSQEISGGQVSDHELKAMSEDEKREDLARRILSEPSSDGRFRDWSRAAEHAVRCANEMTRHAESVRQFAQQSIEGWGPLKSAKLSQQPEPSA